MEDKELLDLYDFDMRISIEYPDMRREAFDDLVRFVRPGPGMSFIHYSRLTAENTDERITEQITRFRNWDGPFCWDLFSHDTPNDLLARLVAHGFEPEEEPGAVMVLDLAQARPEIFSRPLVTIRKIEHKEQLADVIQILETVWGGSFAWINDRFPGHMNIPGYLSVYTAEIDGKSIACAWIYFYPHSHFAGLYGGATLKEFRGQGVYNTLLAVRAQEARERGYSYLTLDAGSMSRPIVARRGFRQLTTVTSCDWKGGKQLD